MPAKNAIQRRSLLKLAALGAGCMQLPKAFAQAPVKRVLLVTKCHLDVGFVLTQQMIVRKYFDVYYPQAIKTCADLRAGGADRYTWTTGSWLLYEYLEQASPQQRKSMEEAIAAGDIAWHALPFTWQTEMLDRSMIEGALGFSHSLDSRFGRKTTGAKMTDVPGHTRGLIAPLQAAGVRVLDIGVNAASTPPDVPEIFLWKDSAGNALAMVYHRDEYGGVVRIPGSDVAVAVEVRGDNSGPHTPAEIAAMYAKLRAQFPGATIQAGSMSDVATAIEPVRGQLPVVTEEIGDTWIYGVASDPVKVAQYREIARLRRKAIERRKFSIGDATDRAMLEPLLLAVEHTWGTDTKSYLDDAHYRPQDLQKVLREPAYQTMQVSWQEKRLDLADTLLAMPPDLHLETSLAYCDMQPNVPSSAGMTKTEAGQVFETAHYTLQVDPATGAIIRLMNHATKREWASPANPLALFTYQTLSSSDYADYRARYIRIKADWAARDFGKPGIEKFGAVSRDWHPRVVNCWEAREATQDRLLMQLKIDDAAALATGNVAWPKDIYLELRMAHDRAQVQISLTTLGKEANRMPEAMWLTFQPSDAQNWAMDKSGESIQLNNVVRGGGRSMHAISESLRCVDKQNNHLEIKTLDAPAVAFGVRSPLNFSFDLPDPAQGAHFSLFNNAWGTNYVQWASGDWLYRFIIAG